MDLAYRMYNYPNSADQDVQIPYILVYILLDIPNSYSHMLTAKKNRMVDVQST